MNHLCEEAEKCEVIYAHTFRAASGGFQEEQQGPQWQQTDINTQKFS